MKFKIDWKSPHLQQQLPPKDTAQLRQLMERLASLAIDTLQKGQKATITLERVE